MRLAASFAIALSACLPPPSSSPPSPAAESSPPPGLDVHVDGPDVDEARALMLGTELKIIVSWSGRCHQSATIINDIKGTEGKWECEGNPIKVDVEARQPFEIFDQEEWTQVRPGNSRWFTSNGFNLIRIRALVAGALTLEIRTTSMKTGQTYRSSIPITAVAPDNYVLECISPRTGAFAPCSRDGMSAARPVLRVLPRIGNLIRQTPMLRVNGRAAPSSSGFTVGVSLLDLVPQARSPTGEGAAPGTYEVVLSVGDSVEKATIEVR